MTRPLNCSPVTGRPYAGYTMTAEIHRNQFPHESWRFNPWTYAPRAEADIASDPQGLLIPFSGQPIYVALKSAQEMLDAQPTPTEGRMLHDGETPHVGHPLDSITGGQKDPGDTGNPKDAAGRAKVPLWLLSPIAKAAWAGAAFIGKVKYGAWNYRGTKVYASVYISAAMRHLDAYLSGETHDPEDGTHHLGNVMACCAILLDCAASGNLIDDRPPSVSLRPAYDEMQALVQPTEARYAGKIVKHWTIDDTKAP